MPDWNWAYRSELKARLDRIVQDLPSRLESIAVSRSMPDPASIAIGSGREVSTCIAFFDIVRSSDRAPSSDSPTLARALIALDVVIPMISRVVIDHGGRIEKNTGDGLMAWIGIDSSRQEAAAASVEASMTVLFVLERLINPLLMANGIEPVHIRVGIDYGTVLIAKIGIPSGTADQDRNFLTAIGPAANIASRLEKLAPTDGICIGGAVATALNAVQQNRTQRVWPSDWTWVYQGTTEPYPVYEFTGRRQEPINSSTLLDLITGKRPNPSALK